MEESIEFSKVAMISESPSRSNHLKFKHQFFTNFEKLLVSARIKVYIVYMYKKSLNGGVYRFEVLPYDLFCKILDYFVRKHPSARDRAWFENVINYLI